MSSTIIAVEKLTKHFKETTAVNNLSFSVPAGDVYGFLGQNGAGKSTTIRMLLTLIKPSSGTISVFGKDITRHRAEVLSQTGAVIEKPDLYNYLSAIENLRIFARLSGLSLSRTEALQGLERAGIAQRADSKVKTFSQGMKQRLGIACALVNNPKLIVLDEPTNGLDPQGIADMRNLILHLSKNEGRTVLVSSHLLSEIELIADSMLIIDRGKKIVEGRVAELLNPADTLVTVQTQNDEAATNTLQQSVWARRLQQGNGIVLKIHREEVPQLIAFLVQQGMAITSVDARHSLENFFLSLTTANQHVAAYTH